MDLVPIMMRDGKPRLFRVDVPPGVGLGVQIAKRRNNEPAGCEITGIPTDGDHFVLKWNKRSAQTFPADDAAGTTENQCYFSAIIGIAEGLIIEAYGENNPQINTQRLVPIRF